MISFALYNIKGGVGKTTTCVNLAYLAAKDGYKTLLWDLDAQGAATFYIGEPTSMNGKLKDLLKGDQSVSQHVYQSKFNNLSFIPSHIKNRNIELTLGDTEDPKRQFKRLLNQVKSNFDYVFFDSPPSLSLLAENLFKSVDFILVPLIPSPLSERTFIQILEFFKKKNLDTRKVVPFFNQVDKRRKIHTETILDFEKIYSKRLKQTIPYLSLIEKMGIENAPINYFAPNSDASNAYRNLWQELKMMPKYKSRRLYTSNIHKLKK